MGQLQLEFASIPLDGLRQFTEQFESIGKMALGFDHRGAGNRPLASELKVLGRLLFVVGTAVMIGEFGRHFGGTFAVTRLFARSDEPMKLNLMASREPTIQHLLVERVMKAEAGRNGAVGP